MVSVLHYDRRAGSVSDRSETATRSLQLGGGETGKQLVIWLKASVATKPHSKSDMMPPFQRIGEPHWDDKLTSFLTSYDVPLPVPATEDGLADCERRIDAHLPKSIRQFLKAFGPVSFDYLTVFNPADIRTPDEWFVESLPVETKSQIDEFIRVADAGGSSDVFALHLRTGTIHLLSHYPLSLHDCLASFDDLIRIACISIHTSYYGWPDEDVKEMAQELMGELFGYAL